MTFSVPLFYFVCGQETLIFILSYLQLLQEKVYTVVWKKTEVWLPVGFKGLKKIYDIYRNNLNKIITIQSYTHVENRNKIRNKIYLHTVIKLQF